MKIQSKKVKIDKLAQTAGEWLVAFFALATFVYSLYKVALYLIRQFALL